MNSPSQGAHHMQVIPVQAYRLSAFQERLFLHAVSKIMYGAFRRTCTQWSRQEWRFGSLVDWTPTVRNLRKTFLFQELIISQMVKNLPDVNGKRRFSTMITRSRRWRGCSPCIQSSSYTSLTMDLLIHLIRRLFLYVRGCQSHIQIPSESTFACRLSAATYEY
jgi:hypothetical protein